MAITGLRTTNNFATDERPKNWREGIMLLFPNGKTPLTAFTSMMKSRSVDDPEYNWWTKTLQSRRASLSADITIAQTTFAFNAVSGAQGGAQQFKAGDILHSFQSGEKVRVAADPTSDTALVVTRGVAGTTAAAISYNATGVDPFWYALGGAYEEGSSAPTGVNFDPTKATNYLQIFRQTLEATNTALQTNLRTEQLAKEAKRECLELFSVDMERQFFLGQKSETTLNGKPLRYTGGLLEFVASANTFTWGSANGDYDGGTTWADFEDIMRIWFQFGSTEKVVFCGDLALLNMQRLIRYAKGVQWTMEPTKEFGMNVLKVFTPFGTLICKQHPLFTQMQGGTTATGFYYGMNSWMWCVDMNELKYVYLRGRDVKYQKDLQENGVDGLKSGYLAECGLEVHHPTTHGILKSFVSYTAES